MDLIVKDSQGQYMTLFPVSEKELIAYADKLLQEKLTKPDSITSTNEAIEYLRQHNAGKEREEFGVVLMDNQHQIIHIESGLFKGTVDASGVYPREIIKLCLEHNAAAVIFFHNHPSGVTTPSNADRAITRKLVNILEGIDVRVLDHFIFGKDTTSFAQKGYL